MMVALVETNAKVLGWRLSRFDFATEDVHARRAPRRELIRLDRETSLHFLVPEGVCVLPGRGDVTAGESLEAALVGVARAHRPLCDPKIDVCELGVHRGPVRLRLLVPAAAGGQDQQESYDPESPHRDRGCHVFRPDCKARLGGHSAILS